MTVAPFVSPAECDHQGKGPCSRCCPCEKCSAIRAEESTEGGDIEYYKLPLNPWKEVEDEEEADLAGPGGADVPRHGEREEA